MFKEGNKRYLPKQPLPVEVIVFCCSNVQLLLIIIYVSLSWGFDLQHRWKLKIVGDQPLVKGFPPFTIPSFKYLDHLLPQGILIAIIAFIISLSAAKTFSRKVYVSVISLCRMDTKSILVRNSLLLEVVRL